MFGSAILEVVIGLVFVYLLMSLLTTTINEVISSFLALRGKNLRKVIAHMFKKDGDAKESSFATLFYSHPLLKKLSIRPVLNRFGIETPPAFLSKNAFTKVVLETLTNKNQIKLTANDIRDKIKSQFGENSDTGKLLLNFLEEANEQVDRFREILEDWFETMMTHAADWYKNKIRVISLLIGLVLTIAFNADTFGIVQKLSVDPEARKAAVELAVAFQNAESGPDSGAVDHNSKVDSLLARADSLVKNEIVQASKYLGMGWKTGFKLDLGWLLPKLFGWLLTAIAISLGAPFWFDILSKVVNLRESTQKQPTEKEGQDATT